MSEFRVRELTDYGTWPWRYIVEQVIPARRKKRWPWSRAATVPVPEKWVQVPHGSRDFRPLYPSDAYALLAHYRATALKDQEGAEHG